MIAWGWGQGRKTRRLVTSPDWEHVLDVSVFAVPDRAQHTVSTSYMTNEGKAVS